MTRTLLAISFSALLLAGCGRDQAEDGSVDRSTPARDSAASAATVFADTGLFGRIDAEPVYLFANLAPLPDALADKVWAPLALMSEQLREAWEAEAEAHGETPPELSGLLAELVAIDSPEALRARGLHPNGAWAIHSVGLYPVMHWQIADYAAFQAMLDRLGFRDQADTATAQRIEMGDLTWFGENDFGLALHHDPAFLTLALVPGDEALLQRVANLTRPERSFDPATLERFNRERGFAPQAGGFLDIARLGRQLTAGGDGVPPQLASFAAHPACAGEFEALAGRMPRISIGLTTVTARELSTRVRLETDSELGNQLSAIANTPVGLSADGGGLMSAGFAINLIAARDFGRTLTAGWVAQPPECPLFANVRDNAANWQLALNRPIPPLVTNLQGIRIHIDDLDMVAGEETSPQPLGSLAVFMRNPQMMVGMAQMFSPELAALDLRPGGEPQRLPAGLVPNLPDGDAFVALGDGAIGLALGESQRPLLSDRLRTGQADDAILSYRLDMRVQRQLLERLGGQLNEQELPGFARQQLQIMGAMAETQEENHFSIHLKAEGVDIINTVTFPP